MQLSNEDNLRLNVLLRQELHAVRIDESKMAVYALTARGEATVPLCANCRDDQYLRLVRELLSSHVLGSPGGYPVYLRRWTRMGQARDASLENLLLLGEPEAVVAVVHAQGLTDELARRAWWVMPTAENARRMLEREDVVNGEMGPVLAEFLLEFLPFEEEPQAMIDSVRLVLQPGLIDDAARRKLWGKAQRKNTYYVGFLQAVPDDLPLEVPAHSSFEAVQARLAELVEAENPFARQLCRVLSGRGQAFLQTAETVLRKPNNQDVVVAALNAIAAYFRDVHPEGGEDRELERILEEAEALELAEPEQDEALQAVRERVPEQDAALRAMLVLSRVGEALVAPIFARSDAIGTVMRRKIEPVTTPILERIARLRGAV